MKYNYSGEVKSVFKALALVRKSRGYAHLADKTDSPRQASVLREAYLASLKADLLILHDVLSAWIDAGAPIEVEGRTDNENDIDY